MRLPPLTPLLAIAAAAAPALAQAPVSPTLVSLQVDVDPPPQDDSPDGGEWYDVSSGSLPAGVAVREFRMRITGTEGGWCYPVLSIALASAYQSSAPDWLREDGFTQPAGAVNWGGCVFPEGDSPPQVWRKRTLQFHVSGALGTAPNTAYVQGWCQPFLTQQDPFDPFALHASTRLWTADAPLWPTPQKQIWMGILEDIATGTSTPRMTAFSGGAAVRQALLMQSWIHSGSFDDAIDYLNSSAFKVAVSEGWLFLAVQVFAARQPNLPTYVPWDIDDMAPDLGDFEPPPKLGITGHAKFAVIWPEHSGGGVVLPGGLIPGQVFEFLSNWATPPVVMTFPKIGGGVTRALAVAAATVDAPGRMVSAVPMDAGSGDVTYQAGLDLYPVKVGHIGQQTGQ